jgi:hypothetical protein
MADLMAAMQFSHSVIFSAEKTKSRLVVLTFVLLKMALVLP